MAETGAERQVFNEVLNDQDRMLPTANGWSVLYPLSLYTPMLSALVLHNPGSSFHLKVIQSYHHTLPPRHRPHHCVDQD